MRPARWCWRMSVSPGMRSRGSTSRAASGATSGIADAIFIGMLPDLPLERFRYIGNSSLTGAYIALLSREHRRRLAEIASRMTYVDLSSNPRYMDSYVKALFLPHTDLEQFPTVARHVRESKEESIVKSLLKRIKAGEILISDGAMGTFLHAKGLQGGRMSRVLVCQPSRSGEGNRRSLRRRRFRHGGNQLLWRHAPSS